MSPHRKLVIAGQAAAVAVLAVVVYLTLLAPDDPGSLSGVGVPGGDESAQVRTPNGRADVGNRDGNGPRSGSRGDQRRRGSAGSRQRPEPGLDGTFAGPSPSGPTTTEDDVHSPSDDQYDDAVSALLDQVGNSSAATD